MKNRRGFTLIELLIVVGIIALLVSILLPAISHSLEMAKQVTCGNNLRQIGVGFQLYTRDNSGYYPAPASYAGESPSDWVWWEPNRIAQIGRSAVGQYIGGQSFQKVLVCPSDDRTFRGRTGNNGYGPYPFSYSMNAEMENRGGNTTGPGGNTGPGINSGTVKSPSAKWIVMEEDENTIDDGYCTPEPNDINLLAIRHDPTRGSPDNTTTGLTINGPCRGNVLFCDFHVDYIDRVTAHSQASYDPNY